MGYLSSEHRIGRRGIVEIMKNLFGLELSTGSVCGCIDRIDPSRGAQVPRSVLGDTFQGVITSDDHSAYAAYHKNGTRQLCWAHIISKFKALKDAGTPDAWLFSKNMLHEVGQIFVCNHAFLHGCITRKQLIGATFLMRARMKKYCLHYLKSPEAGVRTRAGRTLKNWPHLFTFLSHEGVEPTNNIAERAIRPAVQWRKLCFGNQSDEGEMGTVYRTDSHRDPNLPDKGD